jgi:hypothetical protein
MGKTFLKAPHSLCEALCFTSYTKRANFSKGEAVPVKTPFFQYRKKGVKS